MRHARVRQSPVDTAFLRRVTPRQRHHLFPEEWLERPDFADTLKIDHNYQLVVLEEDRSMIHSLQQAMGTRGFQPGHMSKREKPIHNYLQGCFDRLCAPTSNDGHS